MMRTADEVSTVAVLGCGFIGFSWAIVFARHGVNVNLFNRPSPSLDTVLDRVRGGLEFLRDEGVIEEATISESMARITTVSDMKEAVEGASYVQECLPENLELKRSVFADVAAMTPEDVAIGSSCSGLMRRDIVRDVRSHPERCLVAHPTNPPHLLPFMEIAGDDASDDAKESVRRLMQRVGQKPVICGEAYGYVLNRLQLALIQQAMHLVLSGICTVEAVESAVTNGLGLRWAFTGPYGVEELNSASLAEGLVKYKDYFLEGFSQLGSVTDYGDEFVQQSVDSFRTVMGGRNHEQYLAWRDHMVMRTRMLREEGA